LLHCRDNARIKVVPTIQEETMTNYLVAGALLAVTMIAGPAVAQSSNTQGSEPVVVRIKLADLDLSGRQGQRALDRRIDTALIRVCGMPVLYSQTEMADIAACKDRMLASAAPQIAAAKSRQATAIAAR
jgi:UrcA family protein